MQNIRDYIEHLKGKPEAVRRRVAFGASAVITAVVAIAWMTSLSASGTLALSPTGEPQSSSFARTESSNLLGAASAFKGSMNTAGLTVVETNASSTLDERTNEDERTVIPF